MKKILTILFSALFLLSGCGMSQTPASQSSESTANAEKNQAAKKIQVVTTIFPEYDWVREVVGNHGDSVELTLLTDQGTDLHSYQPTVDDLLKISNADLFLYVGGESDGWIQDALKNAANPQRKTLRMMDGLSDRLKEEELKEGMEADHDHDHDHEEADHDHEDTDQSQEDHDHEEADHDHDHEEADHDHEDHEDSPEIDEHVWLSLQNAKIAVQSIADQLSALDPENAADYKKNAEEYIQQLSALDQKYESTLKSLPKNTVVFGDRFPFRYLVEDYHLDYFAAFVGCSAETEASFQTIIFLANKVDELQLPAVFTIEGPDHRIAKSVVENTKAKNQKILQLNSMQSVTSAQIEQGIHYLSLMEDNLNQLAEGLK